MPEEEVSRDGNERIRRLLEIDRESLPLDGARTMID